MTCPRTCCPAGPACTCRRDEAPLGTCLVSPSVPWPARKPALLSGARISSAPCSSSWLAAGLVGLNSYIGWNKIKIINIVSCKFNASKHLPLSVMTRRWRCLGRNLMPEASLEEGKEMGLSPLRGQPGGISWQREIPSGCALLSSSPPSPESWWKAWADVPRLPWSEVTSGEPQE